MDPKPIFISLSPEVSELLADNGVDLVEELQKQLPEVRRGYAPDPAIGDHNRTRDITLVILASSAAFYAVSLGIERIINALGNQPMTAVETELVPVVSPDGKIVRDNNEQPILHWVEKKKILEQPNAVHDKGSLTVSFAGLKVGLENERRRG
ncbi:MAG: hypothetical protein H7Z75_08550 [Ferruginibacter sp.]|nr:hypothetical protein [Cytophagales bacterium]